MSAITHPLPTQPKPTEYTPKPFCCDVCGWHLGLSYRAGGSRITQLMIRRQPRDPEVETPRGTELLKPHVLYCAVEVNDCKVLCGHCGAVTGWYANQTAIIDMLSRRSARKTSKLEVVKNGREEVT